MGVSFASRFSMLIRRFPKRVISRNKTSIAIDRNAAASPMSRPNMGHPPSRTITQSMIGKLLPIGALFQLNPLDPTGASPVLIRFAHARGQIFTHSIKTKQEPARPPVTRSQGRIAARPRPCKTRLCEASYLLCPRAIPSCHAFCRNASALRLVAFAILTTGVFARECALSSLMSSFDQARRTLRILFFAMSPCSQFGRVVYHDSGDLQAT
jgi:hypothetical protein